MQQLPLDLEAPDRFSRDRLVTNDALREVLDVVLTPGQWVAPHLIITGRPGSGKTHLGRIFAEATGARFLQAHETSDLDAATLPAISFVVDDAENASEDLLFHLFNQVQSSRQYLVLLTKIQPLQWQVLLGDWQSRLRSMRVLSLPEPDDELLMAILHKLFAQRAISPSPDSIAYIASRMDRSVSAAQKIVTELEHYANGRAFNRALARDFFEHSDQLPLGDAESES